MKQEIKDEHEWQKHLSKKWRKSDAKPLAIGKYQSYLVCWELMFPESLMPADWKINTKDHFGDPAIDFVLFDKSDHFICLEVKPDKTFKTPDHLLLAFCQAAYAAFKFKQGYDPIRLQKVRKTCLNYAESDRGGPEAGEHDDFQFPLEPIVQPAVAAPNIPSGFDELVRTWNGMGVEKLKELVRQKRGEVGETKVGLSDLKKWKWNVYDRFCKIEVDTYQPNEALLVDARDW